jgi:predicted ester cyclase
MTVEDIVAEGDKVVTRGTFSGTHKGEFMGINPTGKRISVGVIEILRIADGKMVEHWNLVDSLGMMQQLGVVPPPG